MISALWLPVKPVASFNTSGLLPEVDEQAATKMTVARLWQRLRHWPRYCQERRAENGEQHPGQDQRSDADQADHHLAGTLRGDSCVVSCAHSADTLPHP